MGSLKTVGEKLSKSRGVELLAARERVTEGIRLYVSASQYAFMTYILSCNLFAGRVQHLDLATFFFAWID